MSEVKTPSVKNLQSLPNQFLLRLQKLPSIVKTQIKPKQYILAEYILKDDLGLILLLLLLKEKNRLYNIFFLGSKSKFLTP